MSAPRPAWPAARPLMLGFAVLVVFVGGFGAWAVGADMAGAVIASGKIEVERNRQVVQHPSGGVVERVAVDEGDRVEKDDLLVALDATLLNSDLAVIESQLFELMARRGRLEAERDDLEEIGFEAEVLAAAQTDPDVADQVRGQRTLFSARTESLESQTEQLSRRRAQIESQIEGVKAQQAALQDQLSLLDEELADQTRLLDQGLAQASRVLALRREKARLAGTLGELVAQEAQSAGRITELEIELLRLDSDRREQAISQLRDLRYRELELAERRHALQEKLKRLEIRAPVSGVVYGLNVFAPQSVIRAADPLMYIVPQDRPLVVTARIQPIDIDAVYPGQEAVLRFPAFNARTTPELTGRVLQVSADAFTDEGPGLAGGQTYYRAEIVLDDDQRDRLPEGSALIPGMPVDAFIRTGDRSPVSYLTKPFTDYFIRAFRET